jgi:GTP-binding protein
MHTPQQIRNIAIIAHIDHGKTTLLDTLLQQSNVFHTNQDVPERVMDSYDQEKERGITIFSKHTSIYYKDFKINIIDTPGHADFSGEVERVLGMVNSVLLLVDAKEGPMPQTRFVLSKSLQMGIKPIVILNKIDRPHVDPDRVLNETFDLFVELGATDEQLDFQHCYASGLSGFAKMELDEPEDNLIPLLDLITKACPVPTGDLDNPFLIQASTLMYDDYLGRQICGRILEGQISKGEQVVCISNEGKESRHTITKIEGYSGLEKVEMNEAGVGDIICLSGIPEAMIGDTLCNPNKVVKLPPIELESPTISIDFLVNNGPFSGKSGSHVTMNKIKERLFREKRSNISYNITETPGDQTKITVSGRGELHLAVLMEAMRRESFEFCISKPQVITKVVDGVKQEPISNVHIEVPEEYSGNVIEHLSKRRGEMQHFHTTEHGITHVDFLIPTRGIMGYRNDFLTNTRGLGILVYTFDSYEAWKGDIPGRTKGVLISICSGKANPYACFNLKGRGELFCVPTDDVYEGMIVGEHSRDNDLVVNITRAKQLTNVRASGTDENVILPPPRVFSLETAIGYIKDDELIEVTPDALRLRKKFFKETERTRESRKKKG